MSGGGVTPSPTPVVPNLFYRVCPVNDIATPVIVDENGEVCYIDHAGDFSVIRVDLSNMTLSEDSTDAVMTACEAFTGGSVEVEATTDGSGNSIIYNGDYHIAINQSGAIVEGEISEFSSPDVIAVDGAVQVFADAECTKYAKGGLYTFFVRLNRAFGYGEYKLWGSYEDEKTLLIIQTPDSEEPEYKYRVDAYIDYRSQESENAFVAGQIVECSGTSSTLHGINIVFRDE